MVGSWSWDIKRRLEHRNYRALLGSKKSTASSSSVATEPKVSSICDICSSMSVLDIVHFIDRFCILQEYEWACLRFDDSVDASPEAFITIYKIALKNGICFPIGLELVDIQHAPNISLT
ncbi:hypothetical protein Nepgr_001888 [Nepenthes gracilis]|uniref:Uncharacterized protein n=1 Tax=Nepenthes gracilis TaxID=150966 RepID=A0AAD3RXD9_NEPGR|nr:hypothetical protein Nepgr_001888 [Nepenthes gracilis]